MRALLSIMTALLALSASSQGIRDSVFQLNPVEIKADKNFQKESAGMKRTDVDSMVFVSKINLSLSQLLSENTPVFIKDYGRGALATASFRGASASHTQVNWNGIHINSPMTGMVDFSLIPVNLIDEVSLFHGGASIANRSGGLGGSVNIGNRVNWDQKLGVKFIQGIGSYRTFNEYLQIGVGNQIIQSNTRLYFDYSANDFTFINRNIAEIDPVTGEITHPLDTNNNGDYRLYGLLQELYLKANEQNVISVKY